MISRAQLNCYAQKSTAEAINRGGKLVHNPQSVLQEPLDVVFPVGTGDHEVTTLFWKMEAF